MSAKKRDYNEDMRRLNIAYQQGLIDGRKEVRAKTIKEILDFNKELEIEDENEEENSKYFDNEDMDLQLISRYDKLIDKLEKLLEEANK